MRLAAGGALAALGLRPALATSEAPAAAWAAIEAAARGQTVYFHAWGGEDKINAYIAWVGAELQRRHGVRVEHVKLADTGDAVSRVLAEKTAGRDSGGAVDLVWINGANFAAMKGRGLLHGPFLDGLPNATLLDPGSPANRADFTVPTDGFEAPWSLAQLVFYADGDALPEPPRSLDALAAWTHAHPGRFTFPDPANFLGEAFLKQVLLSQAGADPSLSSPAGDAVFRRLADPVWVWLDRVRPDLWRSGRTYPANSAALRTLVADGEVTIGLSFDPAEASAAIAAGVLPPTTRSFVLAGGMLGNASFLGIPYNAAHREGALIMANFLLSAEAQARKQDPSVWGALTVLDMNRLPGPDRARFAALDLGAATLGPDALGPPLPEPHPTWGTRLVQEWTRRYGGA